MKAQIFDELWVESWRAELEGNRPQQAAELIARLGGLRAGSMLIDFGCGIGRVAHALACHGIRVTGIDRSVDALAEARAAENPLCHFVLGDWSGYRPGARFDCAIFWFTTLCAGDECDLETLRIAGEALRPGGVLLIETRHWGRISRQSAASSQRSSKLCSLLEHHSYSADAKIQTTEEHYIAGTRTVRRTYQTRRYQFSELQDMCSRAGFEDIQGFDESGLPLSDASERLVLRARLPASCT
jgi:SAM-dependent methyltransferase